MVELSVNSERHSLELPDDTPLLYVLRNDLALNGPKFGCGLGQCGACAVLVDGMPVFSCVTAVADVEGSEITTLEGLGTREDPHPIQRAFVEHQALQCGYCGNGVMIAAAALLDETPDAGDAEIREALDPYLCRCAVHKRMIAAIKSAGKEVRGEG